MAEGGGMIDVSGKSVTVRTARAMGRIAVSEEAFEVIRRGRCIKGDVLETARVAAIGAVKATSSIIPMCHPLLIESVSVDFELDEAGKFVEVVVGVKSSGKTGVEMEALVGASAACLTIYDMLKYKSRDMVITEIRLLEKTGGKSGSYGR